MDPIAQTLEAANSASSLAFPLAFAAGALSSIGPCVAPRFIAIAGLTCNQTPGRGLKTAIAFICGLTASYAGFGAVTSLLGRIALFSTWLYALIAIVLFAAAIIELWRDEERENHAHEAARTCTGGAAFFLGASFALVVSPCCAPFIVGILAYTSAEGRPLFGSGVLVCFALGHALPLLAAGAGAHKFAAIVNRLAERAAVRVVSAGLMLALAGYYAVVA
jgi:cytochrome c-type biogenesis protein